MSKKIVFSISIFILFFSFVGLTYSQSDQEIISNFIQKQKQIADRSKVKTLYQEMKATIMGMEMPSKIWIKVDNLRYETSFMGQTTTVVLTPNGGWQIQNGSVTDIPKEQITEAKKQLKNQSLAEGFNFFNEDFSEQNTNFEIVGREKIDGVNCYRMKITPKDTTEGESEGYFWFEPNTYLLRKVSFKQKQMGQEQNIDIYIKEYQQVAGMTFPKLINMNLGQGQNLQMEYVTIKVNEPVDDSLFKK